MNLLEFNLLAEYLVGLEGALVMGLKKCQEDRGAILAHLDAFFSSGALKL